MATINEYAMKPLSFKKVMGPIQSSPIQTSAQFEVHTLQWMRQHRPFQKNTPQQLSGYEIIWVTKGSGTLVADLHKYAIGNNSIYCLAPGQLRYFETDDYLEGYYISLSAEFLYMAESQVNFSFFNRQYNGGRNLPVIHADEEMQFEMEGIVIKMMKEVANYFVLRSEILQGLLKIFMIYLSRKFENAIYTKDNDTEIVSRFMELVKKHFKTKKMVADYAGELFVTPNYLNKLVKQMTGFPASHHIQQSIMLEAKRQALYSALSMKEIAFLLGFDNYAHFSKFFKNNSGMNFTSYKNAVH